MRKSPLIDFSFSGDLFLMFLYKLGNFSGGFGSGFFGGEVVVYLGEEYQSAVLVSLFSNLLITSYALPIGISVSPM